MKDEGFFSRTSDLLRGAREETYLLSRLDSLGKAPTASFDPVHRILSSYRVKEGGDDEDEFQAIHKAAIMELASPIHHQGAAAVNKEQPKKQHGRRMSEIIMGTPPSGSGGSSNDSSENSTPREVMEIPEGGSFIAPVRPNTRQFRSTPQKNKMTSEIVDLRKNLAQQLKDEEDLMAQLFAVMRFDPCAFSFKISL